MNQELNFLSSLVGKLERININVTFVANYPWIYLDEVNGKKVKGTFEANHGFTAFFLRTKLNDPVKYHWTDIKVVFEKIRETLNRE